MSITVDDFAMPAGSAAPRVVSSAALKALPADVGVSEGIKLALKALAK